MVQNTTVHLLMLNLALIRERSGYRSPQFGKCHGFLWFLPCMGKLKFGMEEYTVGLVKWSWGMRILPM